MLFKRNQLEDAISSLVEPKARRPSAGLRTRLKRLLETDRALGRNHRSSDPESANYAFFSDDPPGRGVEVQYSEYDGFALLIALRLMAHSWTQNVAVSIMRCAQIELEVQHSRILKLRRENKASKLTIENEIPFLVIITSAGTDDTYEAFACSVREGYRKAIQWTWEKSERGHGFSMFELSRDAQNLNTELARTEPRHRGQPS